MPVLSKLFAIRFRSVDMRNIIIYAVDLKLYPVSSFSDPLLIQMLLKNTIKTQNLVHCPAIPELRLSRTSFLEVFIVEHAYIASLIGRSSASVTFNFLSIQKLFAEKYCRVRVCAD